MLVHVINKHGKPLDPCSPAKAKRLMKDGKAVPHNANTGQFTIRLQNGSSGYSQGWTVGIDPGETVGIAAVNKKGVVAYGKELIQRKDVKDRLYDRRVYRRERRNRLRHRPPRFLNRTKTKCARCGVNNVPKNGNGGRASLCRQCQGKQGQDMQPDILAPSIRNRADCIVNDVKQLAKSLPINEIVVETASFDTQKMADPNISGVEYQEGTLMGWNIRNYLMAVQKGKCAYCKGKSGERRLEIEHIIPRPKGSDRLDNLVLACRPCNEHKNHSSLAVWEKRLELEADSDLKKARLSGIKALKGKKLQKRGFRYSAITQSYKRYLLRELAKVAPVRETNGAVTAYNRERQNLDKSHVIDAIVIASVSVISFADQRMQPVEIPDNFIVERRLKKRKPAQFISDQHKKKIIKEDWDVRFDRYGFTLWDKVRLVDGRVGELVGYISTIKTSGSCRISNIFGVNILARALEKKDATVTFRKLELIRRTESSCIRENRTIKTPECVDDSKDEAIINEQLYFPYLSAV